MKKIYAIIFTLLIFPMNTFAIEDLNISISSVKVEKPDYRLEENIFGEIKIENFSNNRHSDLTLVTSIGVELDSSIVLLDKKVQETNIYLESNRDRVFTFNHMLSKDFGGEARLFAQLYSSDGGLIADQEVDLLILGVPEKRLLNIISPYFIYKEEKFFPQEGPTVVSNDTVKIQVQTSSQELSGMVTPVIKIYNRTTLTEPMATFELDPVLFESNSEYEFELPAVFDSAVYAGTLSFDSETLFVPSVDFRFIVKGDIGTILNVNADTLSGKSGDIINIKVSYAGTPPVINDVFNQEDVEATVFVYLYSEKGTLIGESDIQVFLSDLGDVVLPITLTQKTKTERFRIEAIMKKGDTVLSEYKTELPSEQDIKEIYEDPTASMMQILYLVGIFIFLVFIFFIIKKRLYKNVPTVIIAALIFSGGLNYYVFTGYATTTVYKPATFNSNHFTIVITEPKRVSRGSYNPGEVFYPRAYATFPACLNTSFNNLIYGPSDDWSNFSVNVNEVNSLFEGLNPEWGDYGLEYKIPRLVNWWNQKNGNLIFAYSDSASSLVLGGNQIKNIHSGFVSNKSYTMPTEPGVHRFYMMAVNETIANMATVQIVYQDVCVRGSGECLGESGVCPNLIGNFMEDEEGIIYKDGVVTNYTKNSGGSCVNAEIRSCSKEYSTGGQTCIDGNVFQWSCDSTKGEWESFSVNKTCTGGAGGAWCSLPNQVVSGRDFSTTVRPFQGQKYIFNFPDGTTLDKGTSFSTLYRHSPLGRYAISVEVHKDGESLFATCPFEVVCGPKPLDGKETSCTDGFKKEYVCTQESGYELQTVACLPPVGPPSVSCSASPSRISIANGSNSTGPVVFSAVVNNITAPYSYEWKQGSSIVSTNSTYTINTVSRTGLASWTIPVTVKVNNILASCNVEVTDNTQQETQNPIVSTSTTNPNPNPVPGPNPNVVISNFYFNPSIVSQSSMCKLSLEVSGVSYCKLINRLGLDSSRDIQATDGVIDVQGNIDVPVGTHTLKCFDSANNQLDTSFVSSRQCRSNPSFIED